MWKLQCVRYVLGKDFLNEKMSLPLWNEIAVLLVDRHNGGLGRATDDPCVRGRAQPGRVHAVVPVVLPGQRLRETPAAVQQIQTGRGQVPTPARRQMAIEE